MITIKCLLNTCEFLSAVLQMVDRIRDTKDPVLASLRPLVLQHLISNRLQHLQSGLPDPLPRPSTSSTVASAAHERSLLQVLSSFCCLPFLLCFVVPALWVLQPEVDDSM